MNKQEKSERIKELVKILRESSKAYYAQDREIISNFEYDALYDELVGLEAETGMVLANSPTVTVGYEALEELPKERHEMPMLSLGKTKNREELRDWLKGQAALLSWKLDGLTIVLSYNDGKLAKAVTRGNGEVGEVITNNAKVFQNIPISIPYQEELIVRGEAVISYSDFRKINEAIEDVEVKYKNPRNLCSGSVRQLNNEVTAQRKVKFYAHALVKADEVSFHNSREQQFLFLKEQGFDVVEYIKVTEDTIIDTVKQYEEKVASYDIPSDGLVLCFEDLEYGNNLGRTAKYPRDSIAFKWTDEISETVLKEIEWSPSRTGLINPVAIFEPVELEGSTVARASVHNVSIMQGLQLGVGDKITVYKANMIIPQIADNLTRSNTIIVPDVCPVCGGKTQIKKVNEVQSLYCTNISCEAKKIKSFTLFVSRDALNIEGLSEATLEKFIAKGYIHEFADIFHLDAYREEIIQMEGLGEKSYQNLWESIQKARKTTLAKVIFSLGIANIGLTNAKMICKEYHNDFAKMCRADIEELSGIDGVGEVIATTFKEYLASVENLHKINRLLNEVELIEEVRPEGGQILNGMVFVITGTLLEFDSRNDMKEMIEQKGGKVTGSVTTKTNVLINNDVASSSAKNKKAKELEIPIMTEQEFIQKYL